MAPPSIKATAMAAPLHHCGFDGLNVNALEEGLTHAHSPGTVNGEGLTFFFSRWLPGKK